MKPRVVVRKKKKKKNRKGGIIPGLREKEGKRGRKRSQCAWNLRLVPVEGSIKVLGIANVERYAKRIEILSSRNYIVFGPNRN